MRVLRDFCEEEVTAETARPVPHPLDSSLRWNDEDRLLVIPGEQHETRNPGVFYFYFYNECTALWEIRNDNSSFSN